MALRGAPCSAFRAWIPLQGDISWAVDSSTDFTCIGTECAADCRCFAGVVVRRATHMMRACVCVCVYVRVCCADVSDVPALAAVIHPAAVQL